MVKNVEALRTVPVPYNCSYFGRKDAMRCFDESFCNVYIVALP